MRRFLSYWLPPLSLMAAIFICSAQSDLPHVPAAWLDTVVKKSGHAAIYGLLAWLKLRLLRHYFEDRCSPGLLRWASLALTVAYALSDEYHQRFVPGRNGNLVDAGIDGIGASCAMLFNARQQMVRRSPPAL
ncbi:MAG: VanZ family protein [Anaerolineae bacterium]|nr:VanZ family protein [Anaerolineae bacterium]